jgi:hypothetical protein
MRPFAPSLALALLVAAPLSASPPDPAVKCQADKNEAAGVYAACLRNAEAKAIRRGDAPDATRCVVRFDERWQKIERRGGPVCPSSGDAVDVRELLDGSSATLAAALAGAGVPVCGNELIDVAGEECDAGDLAGRSCADFGFDAGSLSCSGSCKYDTTACVGCGARLGGACWFLGAFGESCADLCGGRGLAYDEATRSFTGSDAPSFDDCEDLVRELTGSAIGGAADGDCASGLGCHLDTGANAVRCVTPETSAEAADDVRRVCACSLP